MYRIFTDDVHVTKPNLPSESVLNPAADTKRNRELRCLAKLLARMDDKNRGLLLQVASKVADRD